jgi:hypothetical protein
MSKCLAMRCRNTMWGHEFEKQDSLEPFRTAWKGVFLAAGAYDRVCSLSALAQL